MEKLRQAKYELKNVEILKFFIQETTDINLVLQEQLKISNKNDIIEKTIKEHKLKEAQKIKQELQNKLNTVESNIENLKQVKKHRMNSPAITKKHLEEEETEEKKEIDRKLKQCIKERQQQEKNRVIKLKEDEDKLKMLEQQKIEQLQKQFKEEAEKKHTQIQQHLEEIEKRKADRSKQKELENEKVKEILNSKPKFAILEENFRKVHENNLLEQKKEKLAQLRNFNKPINAQEFIEFEKHHQEKLKELKIMSNREHSVHQSYQRPAFQSEFYKQAQQQYHSQQVPNENENDKNKNDLMIEYAKTKIKKPQIDEKKVIERENNIKQININKPQQKKKKNATAQGNNSFENDGGEEGDDISPRHLGLAYLKLSKQMAAKKPQLQEEDQTENKDENIKKKQNTTQLTANSDKTFVKIDYLKQLKQQRIQNTKENNHNGDQQVLNNWEKYANKDQLTDKEKFDKIMHEAEKLEQIASKKERQQYLQKGKRSETKNDADADDYYISAIKAKLMILENGDQQKK